MANNPEAYFSEAEEHTIVSAIGDAERMTSGEIRVHVSNSPDTDSLEATMQIFNDLRMYNTKHRNGVLLHISLASRTFAIYGDVGIDAQVDSGFWDNTRRHMEEYFQSGNLVQGICAGVEQVGAQLKQYFPLDKNDKNELPDDISYD